MNTDVQVAVKHIGAGIFESVKLLAFDYIN
jgi:hypothetical protein